jgi:PAS domain S-box-containing protein
MLQINDRLSPAISIFTNNTFFLSMFNIESALSKLVDNTNMFLVCIDMYGNYCYANNAFYKRFTLNNKSAVGRHSLEDIHIDDHGLVMATVDLCWKSPNTAHEIVVRKPTPSGDYIYTKWDFIAMTNESDSPYILCIGFEITGFIENIAANVTRLQEIAFDQSHLVRRPLANILGLSKLLAETNIVSEDETKDFLSQLHSEAQQLDNIIKLVNEKTQKE